MQQNTQKSMATILAEFNQQLNYIQSFITDPTGARFFEEKDPILLQQRLREHVVRTADFLDFIGNPHHTFNSVHVAGTSGKGSVVTMIAAILTECKLHTGYHISPYVQICNEKFVINGKMIKPSQFVDLVEHFKQHYNAWTQANRPFNHLRYGEAWVSMVYLWFAQQQVDWAVVETGFGGRFNATNVLPSKLSVITNINFDHVKALGPTLADIAYHKAGIIKPNSLAVTTVTNPNILPIIKTEADQKKASLYCFEKDFSYTVENIGIDGVQLSVQTPFKHYQNIFVSLSGSFQLANAALAITAVDILAQNYPIPLSEAIIKKALSKLNFSGRLEVVQTNPIVILDGAHNPHKMQALVDSLQQIYPTKKITIIIGVLRGKDATEMIEILQPIATRFIVTQPQVLGKLPLAPSTLADIISTVAPTTPIKIVEQATESIDLALKTLAPDDLLVITGSFYLISQARNYWYPAQSLLQQLENSELMNSE